MAMFERPRTSPERDPSTLSNYGDFKVNKTALDLKVDFELEKVVGAVEYLLTKVAHTDKIWLDSSYLKISSASVNGVPTDFTVEKRLSERPSIGCRVDVKIPQSVLATQLAVKLEFETTKECTALQFLPANATDGKTGPYLFSQCQAIHARSLFPCFDTPAVKCPYIMLVDSPYPLVMSGRPQGVSGSVYRFIQPVPIPSYLVAIASGDIKSAPIGPRSLVYSEPVRLSLCQHEFEADMENFLQAAELLVFKYEWERYDALVLPLSFPFGGMENPNITFVTPTLILGDRENVDVIAHELAHSWLGNLVTNCSWEHFWLNEGWTVYLERRIVGKLHGESTRDFSAIIGWTDLENAIAAMGDSAARWSLLVHNLQDGSDPDEAFSAVPYEKGSTLLYHIEKLLGKESFDKFIPHYFETFRYKSLDTYQFLDCLYGFFADKKAILDLVDWNTWLFKPGMPPVKPDFDTTMVDQCYHLADRWYHEAQKGNLVDFLPADIASFTANQSVVFLDTLVALDKSAFKWRHHTEALNRMAEVYSDYSKSTNAEVLFRWFVLQVTGRNRKYYHQLGEWLGTVGRMKFVRPGYVLLNAVDRPMAIHYFQKFKDGYHAICRGMVKKDLGLTEAAENGG